MGPLTFVPVWVIQDVIVLVVALLTAIYIIKHEKHPEMILVEFECFVFLYAGVYENFACYFAKEMNLYGYGRSLLMLFNVSLPIPIFCYLVVYSTLKMLETMKIPTWCKPVIVGLFGLLADVSLDFIALKQVYTTAEGTIGRYTWFLNPGDVNIFNDPIYNFTGWVMILGFGAAVVLLGRYLFAKSGEKPAVSYVFYPFGFLLALGLIVCPPIMGFLIRLAPFYAKGSVGEWIMLVVWLVIPAVFLLAFWRGKMKGGLSLKTDYPVFVILGGFHFVNILFSVIGGYWEIIPIQAAGAAVHCAIIALIYLRGRAWLKGQASNILGAVADKP